MAEIKKIHVGTTDYDLAALYLQETDTKSSVSGLKTWADIKELMEASFDLQVISGTLPVANATSYNTYHNSIVLCNNGETPETGTYVEWVITKGGTASTPTYAWEKIGTTATDLSDYAKKTEAGKAGSYNTSTPSVANTGSADLGTATGTATVTYSKATLAASGGTHSHTVSASAEYTPAGAISVGTSTTKNYTPSGSVTGSYNLAGHSHDVNAATASFTAVTAGPTVTGSSGATGTAATSGGSGALTLSFSAKTFNGTKANLTVPDGTGTVKIDNHSYKPAGTIGGSQTVAAHNHTVTRTTLTVGSASGWSAGSVPTRATTTVVSGVGSSATVLTGVKSSGTANVNTDAIKSVTLSAESATATGRIQYVQSISSTGASASGTTTVVTGYPDFSGGSASLSTKNYGFGSSTSDVMYGATVSNGILSWSTKNAATQDAISFTAAKLNAASTASVVTGVTGGTATATTKYLAATGNAAATTAVITGVTSNGTASAVTSLSTKDIWEITGVGSAPALTVTDKTVMSGVSLADGGNHTINGSNFSFTGTNATIKHVQTATATTDYETLAATVGTTTAEYTPAGTLTLTGTAPNHSHSYTAPADHTHSVGEGTKGTITYMTSATIGKTSGGTVNGASLGFSGTGVDLKFTGTAATISSSGTAADAGGHTHSISTTDASATGSVSVAIGTHTHTLGNHTHSVTVSAIAS